MSRTQPGASEVGQNVTGHKLLLGQTSIALPDAMHVLCKALCELDDAMPTGQASVSALGELVGDYCTVEPGPGPEFTLHKVSLNI